MQSDSHLWIKHSKLASPLDDIIALALDMDGRIVLGTILAGSNLLSAELSLNFN